MALTPTRRIVVHVAFLCLSGFLLGYDLCVIGSILTPVQRTLELCFPCEGDGSDSALAHCTCPAKQLAVSAVSLGAIAGGLLGGWTADRCGRRTALALTDVLFIIGAAGMASAQPGWEVMLFFCGRALAGAALGAAGAISSAYIAELAPPHVRGRLLIANEVAVCVGCLVAYVAAVLFGDEHWRWTLGIAALPAFLQLLGLASLLLESPRWLTERGQSERASAVAAKLGLDAAPLLNFLPNTEAKVAMRVQLRAHGRPLILAAGCALAHAASAANVVLYYSRDILQATNLSNPLLANVGVGVAKLLGVLLCVVIVDHVGRRKLLLLGSAGMFVSYAGLVAAFTIGTADGRGGADLALACLLLFILAWDISWAGLMLTVAAELLPQPVRGLGIGIAYSLYWILSFAESQTLETLFDTLGHSATFSLYGAATTFSLYFSWRFVPETKGASLEGIAAAATSQQEADDASAMAEGGGLGCAQAASNSRAESESEVSPESGG